MTEEPSEGELIAGKYRVERTLARGGMGAVYLARHVELDQLMAVKMMLPEAAKNPEAVTRFMREARAAVKIKSNHVVRVTDVGTLPSGLPYMAMEYLEGKDLREVLAERGRLPLEEAAEYMLQALEALAEAHARGIVHRDLKPGNLFLTQGPDGTPVVKVLDFGISKVITGTLATSDPLTKNAALMGSPLYMSPEQMKASRNVDMRADIWAIGVMFYELLTGDVPFKGDSLPELCAVIVLDGATPKARDVVPELPQGVDELIGRCLARKRDERFANAAEVARALAPFAPERARPSVDRVIDALGPLASLQSVPLTDAPAVAPDSATDRAWTDTKPEHARRSRFVLGAALGTLALAGVGALAFVGGSTERGATHGSPPVPSETPPRAAESAPGAAASTSPPEVALPRPAPSASAAPISSTKPAAASPSETAPRPLRPPPRKTPDTEENPFGGRR
jgi:serine/threonine-protein kinase